MNDIFYQELQKLEEKYNALYNSNIIELNNLLDGITLDINSIEFMPKIIISRAIYEIEGTNILDRAKFVIRPTIKYNLDIHEMKRCFILFNTPAFFVNFIEEVKKWGEEYELYKVMEYNLMLLNNKIKVILKETDFPYSIKFTVGDGIMDISDNDIELGLSMEKVLDIPNTGFFIEDDYWNSAFIEKFVNSLKECNRPYDIVKIKSDIFKDMGIYNRRSVVNLIRKFVNRSANHVRAGVGYIDVDNIFGIVEKIAISEKDIEKYNVDEVILEDNLFPTVIEKKQGLNKIITRYKLIPFDKQTNVMVDRNIKELYEYIQYKKGGLNNE